MIGCYHMTCKNQLYLKLLCLEMCYETLYCLKLAEIDSNSCSEPCQHIRMMARTI